MKNILLFSVMLFYTTILSAQATIAGSCDGVITIVNQGPSFNNRVFTLTDCPELSNSTTTKCKVVNPFGCQPSLRKYRLQRLNTLGNWINQTGFQTSPQFSPVSPGTYRVATIVPIPAGPTPQCESGLEVISSNSQVIGIFGFYDITRFSNEINVGPATTANISARILDANDNSLFNPGDPIMLNTTGTSNHTNWWVAIFENGRPGGNNRYFSNGWTFGTVPTNLNLKDLSFPVFPDGFEQIPASYTVQFAIGNPCNTSWASIDLFFAICPAGLGCRFPDVEKEIILAPNPASNYFQLLNLDFDSSQQCRILITDIRGRTIKVFNEDTQSYFDVSDIANGIYFVQAWKGSRRIFTSKLSIIH